MNVLVLNSGSSSLKFQLISTDLEHIKRNEDRRLCRGVVERIGGEAIVTVNVGDQPKHVFTEPLANLQAAVDFIVKWVASDESGIAEVENAADIHAVGNRVVHGGE